MGKERILYVREIITKERIRYFLEIVGKERIRYFGEMFFLKLCVSTVVFNCFLQIKHKQKTHMLNCVLSIETHKGIFGVFQH
jgi:hypothetical protein